MAKRLFSYLYGMLFIIMQFSHALTLQEIEEEARYHYDDALDHLPEKQKNLLIRGQKAWLQYRDLRCEMHETIFQGNAEQCKIAITFRYNLVLKILRPNQLDMIRFFKEKITQSIIRFQKAEPQYLNENIDASIAQKLNSQYQQFYSQLDSQERLKLHKSYVAWLSYRNQACLLLNSRNIIQYNYCATKLSLDVIFDMQHYLNQ